jgi:polyferredoxin
LYTLAHPKKKLPERTLPQTIDQKTRYTKYLVLFAVIVISAILGTSSVAGVEPFLTLFAFNGTVLAWSLLGFMLTLSFFHFRFWCKYLCPVGACLGLFSRFSLYKIKLGKEECSGCAACEQVCPTRAITMAAGKPAIDYPECILCGRCVNACPKKKIKSKGKSHASKLKDI